MVGLIIKSRKFILFTVVFLAGVNVSQAQQSRSNSNQDLINRYCVSCHNKTLKTANLLLDKAKIDEISQAPALWERVNLKLTLRAMPPVGMPLRPSESEYQQLIGHLQSELDGLADRNSNPGSVTVHRLNRSEYSNAIKDLLAIDIDAQALLPPDNIGQGFDNIAEVLAVSPLLMEQYMFAASKISKLAIGPDEMLPVSESYSIDNDYRQNERMNEDLPLGSRGGMAFNHYFPMDGEYTVNVKLHRSQEGYIRGIRKAHQVDFRLDHERINVIKVGGEIHGRSGPLFNESQNPQYAGDPVQTGYEFTADEVLKVTFPAKAGSHLVSASFINETTKPTGMKKPEMTLLDIGSYKGGDATVASVTITGPRNATGPGLTASRQKIFICSPESQDEQDTCAQEILSTLARSAYRRPVTNEDMNELMALFQTGRMSNGFKTGVGLAIQGILSGPEFLFRVEQDPGGVVPGSIYPISDMELASRLSFFLWSSIPDDELISVADQGRLRDPKILNNQVKRMMSDPRSEDFIKNFGEQWLGLRNMDIFNPHPEVFPEFDDELREAMRTETELWFREMIREDRSIDELLTADFTYLNERLAKHYGISGVSGSRFRRVSLSGYDERIGLLGKGSLLAATSYNNRTSPVLRGKWVLENLLSMPPPPPPDDAFQPVLEVENENGTALTMKQAMEKHRANPVCATCHKLMDPIGFALENYNAIGSYRTRYEEANADVESAGILFDGMAFSNTSQFRDRLLVHSDRIAHTVTEKMLTYALGRGIEYYDQPEIRDIVRKISAKNTAWTALIQGIIESTPFQYRKAR
ncbi:MAG: cytochrome c5 [Gammaproteobacteria bacterium]|jgi:cytochrome c5